jgi:hypothetical protein
MSEQPPSGLSPDPPVPEPFRDIYPAPPEQLVEGELLEGWLDMRHNLEEGASIHELGRQGGAYLAKHGEYTATFTPEPTTFADFLAERRTQEMYKQIATNTREQFKGEMYFSEAAENGSLGSELAASFQSVKGLIVDNIHVPESNIVDGREMGTVVAEKTLWLTETEEAAQKLSVAIGVLLRRQNAKQPVAGSSNTEEFRKIMYPDGGAPETPVYGVICPGLNEHDARSLARIVGALVDEERATQDLAVQPVREKRSLYAWDQDGQKYFPPEHREELARIDHGYAQTRVEATYGASGAPEGTLIRTLDGSQVALASLRVEGRPDNRIITTDLGAYLRELRGAFNGMIRVVRDPRGNYNPEQNPKVDERPLIERQAKLKRDLIPEDIERLGPASGRSVKLTERGQSWAVDAFEKAKRNKISTAVKVGLGVAALLGSGVFDGLKEANKLRPRVAEAFNKTQEDRQAWIDRKAAYEADQRRVEALITRRIEEMTAEVNADHYVPRAPGVSLYDQSPVE